MPIYTYNAFRVNRPEDSSWVAGYVKARTRAEAKEKLKARGLRATRLQNAGFLEALMARLDRGVE